MQTIFPFYSSKSISGEASIEINKPAKDVFSFVAENIFVNYPKWESNIIEVHPLETGQVCIGTKAKQIKKINDEYVESIFEIIEYKPDLVLSFKGIKSPYKHTYFVEDIKGSNLTRLTFKFELLDIEIFIWPFENIIRTAIEEGVNNTVAKIKELLTQ